MATVDYGFVQKYYYRAQNSSQRLDIFQKSYLSDHSEKGFITENFGEGEGKKIFVCAPLCVYTADSF